MKDTNIQPGLVRKKYTGIRIQEIWANAHETRHSISLISYTQVVLVYLQ